MSITIIEAAIEATIAEATEGKIDWSQSIFLEVKELGKNSVGGLGEHLYDQYQKQVEQNLSQIIRSEHDVLIGTQKKVEVKTAFQNKQGGFFFNQIRYNLPSDHPRAGQPKDWTHLAFVFVKPDSFEIWECERPAVPEKHFRWNNDWSWNGTNAGRGKKLCTETWKRVYGYVVHNVGEGHQAKQSYANTRKTGKEQYYTTPEVVDLCMSRVKAVVGIKDQVFLEPAGGTGEFIEGFRRAGIDTDKIVSYDIEPLHTLVQEQNFLETTSSEAEMVCVTNPPFGRASSLAKKFFNHAASSCKYICFLVPKSWRKWTVMNSLDSHFHLVDDIDLPQNCFYTSKGDPEKQGVLNTVFQIWEHREEERQKIKVPDHNLMTKIRPVVQAGMKVVSGANFEIITFGHSCGKTKEITAQVVPYKTTTMYLNVAREDVKRALEEIDLSCYYNNVAYVQALSIQEINFKLNEHFGLSNFDFKEFYHG